jgi:UDPglucose 6-dehydrogenase
MKIAVVGSGYVGLVTGACLADFGHSVVCVDKDQSKIEALRRGKIPIFEPGLEGVVLSNTRHGRLAFTSDTHAAVAESEAVFIAVGTPSAVSDGNADLTYVRSAVREIARALQGFTVIVNKSTVPVGTGDEIEALIRGTNSAADFAVVSNPEFLREGTAIADFKRPDRVVVGTDDERAKAMMTEIYRPLDLPDGRLFFTSRRSSELIKYASNAFLATKITFINEIADLCEAAGANVQAVAHGMGLDYRIGSRFLQAGPGYGGSCFPKDTLALVKTGRDLGAPQRIVEAVVELNDQRKRGMAQRIIQALGGDVKDRTLALLGLAFKPNTDDMRYAPSLDIVEGLRAAGAAIKAFDPESMDEARKYMKNVEFCRDAYSCVSGADAAVVVTEWDSFRALNLSRIKAALRRPIIVDLRNIYRPADMERNGFQYYSIGRPPAAST